jgi:SAM-dependent methyltransferase
VKHFGLSNISFEVQDAENIKGHGEGEFDAAFSFSAFRYLPSPEKALGECFRLVKKGGSVVIDFPNKYCPWFLVLKPLVFIKKHIHDRLFTEPQIRRMMEEAGFVDIEVRRFLFTYKELPGFLLPVMKAVDFVLEHTPLIRKASAIIMVKGKKP